MCSIGRGGPEARLLTAIQVNEDEPFSSGNDHRLGPIIKDLPALAGPQVESFDRVDGLEVDAGVVGILLGQAPVHVEVSVGIYRWACVEEVGRVAGDDRPQVASVEIDAVDLRTKAHA